MEISREMRDHDRDCGIIEELMKGKEKKLSLKGENHCEMTGIHNEDEIGDVTIWVG